MQPLSSLWKMAKLKNLRRVHVKFLRIENAIQDSFLHHPVEVAIVLNLENGNSLIPIHIGIDIDYVKVFQIISQTRYHPIKSVNKFPLQSTTTIPYISDNFCLKNDQCDTGFTCKKGQDQKWGRCVKGKISS